MSKGLRCPYEKCSCTDKANHLWYIQACISAKGAAFNIQLKYRPINLCCYTYLYTKNILSSALQSQSIP